MKTEVYTVANLSCSGCESTIRAKILHTKGVKSIVIEREKDRITIEQEDSLTRIKIAQVLSSLGYPEATEENGMLMHLKSYVSCVMGKIKTEV